VVIVEPVARYTVTMQYALWHIPSGNLVSTFEREVDALVVVRRVFEQGGREAGESFALGAENRRGRIRPIANGPDLLTRALSSGTGQTARSA
jgi:hypothetical protein